MHLASSRLVVASETEERRRLAISTVKSLTGDGTVAGRALYAPVQQFTPTFKIFLSTNFRPEIASNGHAIWRDFRMRDEHRAQGLHEMWCPVRAINLSRFEESQNRIGPMERVPAAASREELAQPFLLAEAGNHVAGIAHQIV